MDSSEFKSAWDRHKNAFKQQHPQVSDDELACDIGKEEEFLQRLQERLGKTKKEIRDWLHMMG